MSRVALARLERPHDLAFWTWALTEQDDSEARLAVRALNADGEASGGVEQATAQHVVPPPGCPAWLVNDERVATPCVMVSAEGSRLRLHTPRGEVLADTGQVRPVAAPGSRPHAAGPSLITARTELRRVAIDARRFALRWALTWLRGVFERDGLGGGAWIDVALLPHQIAVVRTVLGAPSVRHVLADEVGLGKTIEALMIWSALSAHDPKLRCVIAAQRHLVSQWCLEVRRRTEHRLTARATDDIPPVFTPGGAVDAMDADNPRGIVVTTHEALTALKGRASVIDMLIVDEAHALNGDQRDAISAIAGPEKHLLLLTATPKEGRRARGAARGYRKALAWAVSQVDPKWPPPAWDEEAAALEQTLDESLLRARECDGLLAQAEGGTPVSGWMSAVGALSASPLRATDDLRAALRESTLLERVLRSRRRKAAARLTATRRLIRVPIEYRAEELAVLETVRLMDPVDRAGVIKHACSSWDALAGMAGGKTAALRSRLDVIRDGRLGHKPDAKLEALLDLCARIWWESPEAKVVIRCECPETCDRVAEQLARLLRSGGLRPSGDEEQEAWGSPGEESVGPVARLEKSQDSMLEALLNPGEAGRSMLAQLWAFERPRSGALVLVAGDLAATGLNLQFASALIFYDLPWTPGLAEQWIGRLDRVGQRADEVPVYVMSHDALPTERLIDLYESIGLFDDRGFQVTQEVERRIEALLHPTEDDEATWEESVRKVQKLIDEDRDEGDASRGVSLDLPVDHAPAQDEVRRATSRLLRFVDASGFAVEDQKDFTARITWRQGARDALWLPGAAAALRPRESSGLSSNPEKIAEQQERRRAILVTDRRLGEGRWLRAWSVSLLTPRHPLLVEMGRDLLGDPSLALAHFTCSTATARVPAGTYVIAQTQTFPALGGAAMSWRCGRSLDLEGDEELARIWANVDAALQRMMRTRGRTALLCAGWRVATDPDPWQSLGEEHVDALIEALPTMRSTQAAAAPKRLVGWLEGLEQPSEDLLRANTPLALFVAQEVERVASLRVARAAEKRRDDLASVGIGDAWRGLRERRECDLKAAEALLQVLRTLPDCASAGAEEASTPRVVAAAAVEVFP